MKNHEREEKDLRRCRFIGMLCSLLLIIIGYQALAQENHGPRMVLEERVFDFGEVKEGEVIEHTFKFFNKGEETLRIIRVKPG